MINFCIGAFAGMVGTLLYSWRSHHSRAKMLPLVRLPRGFDGIENFRKNRFL
jgi:hypothetical protein